MRQCRSLGNRKNLPRNQLRKMSKQRAGKAVSKDPPGQLVVISVNEVGPGFRGCVMDLRGTSTIGCLKSSTSFQTSPLAQSVVHVRIWGSAGWHGMLSTPRKYSTADTNPRTGALLRKLSPVLKRNYPSL